MKCLVPPSPPFFKIMIVLVALDTVKVERTTGGFRKKVWPSLLPASQRPLINIQIIYNPFSDSSASRSMPEKKSIFIRVMDYRPYNF